MPLGISTHSLAQRAEAAAQAMNRDMQQAGSLQGAVVAAARLLEAPIGSGRTAEPQTECKVLRIPLTDIKPMAGVTIRERCPPSHSRRPDLFPMHQRAAKWPDPMWAVVPHRVAPEEIEHWPQTRMATCFHAF